MISHKNKCIFVHIPKTAGSSVNRFYFTDQKLDWKTPNYELLYGWCPKRNIHLQHATSKQLLETGLISEEVWKSYFKFSFVRNPWDRSYSDYLWIMSDCKVKGSFKEYILKEGAFKKVLTDSSLKSFRGDHLLEQSEFLDVESGFELDFIGRFETFKKDISIINQKLDISNQMNIHEKKNTKRLEHYSHFYTNSKKKIVDKIYSRDINNLNYTFEDTKKGLQKIKNIL